jgi:hypothetical protein
VVAIKFCQSKRSVLFTLSFINSSIGRQTSQNGRSARDPIKSDSRLATNATVSFYHSFSETHYLFDKPMTYSDFSPLLYQDTSSTYSTPRSATASTLPKSLFRPSPLCFPCSQVSLKPISGPVLPPVPGLIEYQLGRIREGRWNQFGIPSFLCQDTLPSVFPSSI